jgi:hypothetical protein
MSGQQFIPKQTDEEREARRVKLEAEAERRAEWRWGNYFRESATGGGNNGRMFDWSRMPPSNRS